MKKRINFPSRIKVAGHSYKVIYPYIFREEEDALGQCHYPQCKIRIQDSDCGMRRDIFMLKSSFLHELLHIIDHVYNNNKINNLDDGEDIIIRLTSGWLQVLVDNNLFLGEPHKMPKTIKIGGLKYKVIHPYSFEENDNISSVTSHQTLELFIGQLDVESDSYAECGLISLILATINIQYKIDKGDTNLLKGMVEGIYQVFKDNDIPKIIRGK